MSFFSDFMKYAWIIIVFGIIIFLFLFLSVGYKQIISENILEPIVNSSIGSAQTAGLRADTEFYVRNAQDMFDSQWFNFDLFFLVFFLTAFTTSVYGAARLTAPNFYTFWGIATFGTMLFLLILTIVGQVRDWLLLNFYTNLFDLTLVSTPIIDWFLINLQIISFVWFLILLLVAFLDWKGIIENIIDSTDTSSGEFQK